MSDGELFIRRVCDEHGAQLRGCARRWYPRDPQQAEDLVQETLLRAWRAQVTDPGWLMTVMGRVAIDGWRRRRGRRDVQFDPAVHVTAVSDGTDLVAVRMTARAAMSLLRPEERSAVAAIYLADLPIADAAAVLGIPEGTVKSRASRGLRRLRRAARDREVWQLAG